VQTFIASFMVHFSLFRRSHWSLSHLSLPHHCVRRDCSPPQLVEPHVRWLEEPVVWQSSCPAAWQLVLTQGEACTHPRGRARARSAMEDLAPTPEELGMDGGGACDRTTARDGSGLAMGHLAPAQWLAIASDLRRR